MTNSGGGEEECSSGEKVQKGEGKQLTGRQRKKKAREIKKRENSGNCDGAATRLIWDACAAEIMAQAAKGSKR
jgi:hypothetical protein